MYYQFDRNRRDYKRVLLTIYTSKLNNLDEMDRFLEAQYLPRRNHKEIENLNRCVTNKEIESIIKSLQRKILDLMASVMNFTKHLKNQHQSFSKFSKKLKSRDLCNLLYEASVIPDCKTRQRHKRENSRLIFLLNTDVKILNRMLPHQIQWHV